MPKNVEEPRELVFFNLRVKTFALLGSLDITIDPLPLDRLSHFRLCFNMQ